MTVRVPPNGRQAKPNRGATLFQSVLYGAVGQPSTPANLTTPGVPDTGLMATGSKPFIRLLASTMGVSVSQRSPKFSVRFGPTVQSSCTNAARYQLDRSSTSVSRMVTLLGNPSSRLARP